jgi:hypothetical protein
MRNSESSAHPYPNTESGLSGRERHVVGNHRLGEALEGERADLFGGDASPAATAMALAQAIHRHDPGLQTAGYLANVGRKGVRRSMKERASGRTEIF